MPNPMTRRDQIREARARNKPPNTAAARAQAREDFLKRWRPAYLARLAAWQAAQPSPAELVDAKAIETEYLDAKRALTAALQAGMRDPNRAREAADAQTRFAAADQALQALRAEQRRRR